jgi:hypothetical protein
MVLQRLRPIWSEARKIADRCHGEPFVDGLMKLRRVGDIANCFGPMKPGASHSYHAFIVHHPVGRRVKAEEIPIHEYAASNRNLRRDKIDHPIERDVRKPRLVFGITPTDIGVVSGEPNLVKLLRLSVPIRPFHGAFPSPRYSLEVLSTFIDRLKVASVLNVGRKMPVVSPFRKEALPADRRDRIPYTDGTQAAIRSSGVTCLLVDSRFE